MYSPFLSSEIETLQVCMGLSYQLFCKELVYLFCLFVYVTCIFIFSIFLLERLLFKKTSVKSGCVCVQLLKLLCNRLFFPALHLVRPPCQADYGIVTSCVGAAASPGALNAC